MGVMILMVVILYSMIFLMILGWVVTLFKSNRRFVLYGYRQRNTPPYQMHGKI